MSDAINFNAVDRCWFLTWTTYGTWLPGDKRGFVGWIEADDGAREMLNKPNSPLAPPDELRRRSAASRQNEDTVFLTLPNANQLLEQFQETTLHRGWFLSAVAIMPNHIHLLLGVSGDPDPEKLLRDLKSWATRRLNDRFEPRPRWWTKSGSKRRLPDRPSIETAIEYIRRQHRPLLIWIRGEGIVFRSTKG